MLIGILESQTLVGEQTYLVVHQLNTNPMIGVQKHKGHVGSDIHGLGGILETGQRHSIGTRHIEFRLLAGCCRVKRRLHRPIVGERRFLLG